jgi:hypothetical protein
LPAWKDTLTFATQKQFCACPYPENPFAAMLQAANSEKNPLLQCCNRQIPKRTLCYNVASNNFQKEPLATMLQAVNSEKNPLLQCCKQQIPKRTPCYIVASINFRKELLATL